MNMPLSPNCGQSLRPRPVKWQLQGSSHAGTTVLGQLQVPNCPLFRNMEASLGLEHTRLCPGKGVSGGASPKTARVKPLWVSQSEAGSKSLCMGEGTADEPGKPSWGQWPAGVKGARSRPNGRVGLEEERLQGFPEEFLSHLLQDKSRTHTQTHCQFND